MPKTNTSLKKKTKQREDENVYFLRLVIYLILGSQWLRISVGDMILPIPIGLIIGLLLTKTQKYSLDRKIAYSILLLTAFIAFWLPIGIVLSL